MRPAQFAALLGFLFVVVWVAGDLGDAILCLIGAAVFSLAAAAYRGELDLTELQQRVSRTQR